MEDNMLMFPKTPGRKKKKRVHRKSIMQEKDGTCYLCTMLYGDYSPKITHEHHVFGGINRHLSEEYGLKVFLCLPHHLYGPEAVHTDAGMMKLLHEEGQRAFERERRDILGPESARQEFVRIFGKNYLG